MNMKSIRCLFLVSLLILLLNLALGTSNQVGVAQNAQPQTVTPDQVTKPARTILFYIDGLHWQAPQRLKLQNIQALAAQGTTVETAYQIIPWHPTTGTYGDLHTTSLPNPITLAGNLFLYPGHQMIQEQFLLSATAMAANSTAYASLTRGFRSANIDRTTDAKIIQWSLNRLKNEDIRFLRIQLQDTGTAGQQVANTQENVPWRRNIWGKDSPYIAKAREADRLLGTFVENLRQMGKWDDTLLIITADGQADTGWHPIMSTNSWLTPLIFVGPGVAQGRTIPYGENIDIAPTIANLMGVTPPNPGAGAGRILEEIKDGSPTPIVPTRQRVKELNELIREYLLLQARMRLLALENPDLDNLLMKLENALITENQFYGIDRILEWREAGSIDNLIETNRKVVTEMKQALAEFAQLFHSDHK